MSEKNKFTNSAGRTFPIIGLSPIEIERIRKSSYDKFSAAGRRLTPPTYDAITADGTKQTFEHTELTVETDEDRAALADYLKTKDELEIDSNTKLSRAAMLSVDVDPITDSRWVARMKILDIKIPDEEFEKLTLYVETQVLKSVEDIAGLMTAVLYAGGTVDEEGMAAAESSFRLALADVYKQSAVTGGPA